MVINNVTQAYKAMSPGDIAQAKANQTANNTAGIIQYFRAKIAAMGGSVAMFNKTIAFIYQPLVQANWQTTITAFNLNQPANQSLKKTLNQNLQKGQNMAAGCAFLTAQLAAATSLQPPTLTTVTAFVNQLCAISL